MICLGLSGCVPKKLVKMRNKRHFITSSIRYMHLYLSYVLNFIIFSVFFLIFVSQPRYFTQENDWEGTLHASYRTIINLFQDKVANAFPKNVSYGQRCPPGSWKEGFETHCNFPEALIKYCIYIFKKEVATFSSLSTHPVNSVFSAVVRIYKILVIDKAFFPLYNHYYEKRETNFFLFLCSILKQISLTQLCS